MARDPVTGFDHGGSYSDLDARDQARADAEAAAGTPTWGDYANTFFNVGVPEIGEWLSSGVRAGAESQLNNPEVSDSERLFYEGVVNTSTAVGNILGDYKDDTIDTLSPAMQQRLNATFTSEQFWQHPISVVAAQATRTLPTMGVAGAVGLMTPAGAFASVAMAGVAGGTLTAAQSVDEFYSLTDSMSDEQLQKESAGYRELRETMDEEEARRVFNEAIRGNKPAYLFAFGALTNAFGPAGQLVRGVKGAGMAGGLLKRVGKGVAGGATSETLEEGAQATASEQVSVDAGLQEGYNYERIIDSALMGGAIGGVLGGGAGVVSRRSDRDEGEPEDSNEGTAPASHEPQAVSPGGLGAAGTATEQGQPANVPEASTGAQPVGHGSKRTYEKKASPSKKSSSSGGESPAQTVAAFAGMDEASIQAMRISQDIVQSTNARSPRKQAVDIRAMGNTAATPSVNTKPTQPPPEPPSEVTPPSKPIRIVDAPIKTGGSNQVTQAPVTPQETVAQPAAQPAPTPQQPPAAAPVTVVEAEPVEQAPETPQESAPIAPDISPAPPKKRKKETPRAPRILKAGDTRIKGTLDAQTKEGKAVVAKVKKKRADATRSHDVGRDRAREANEALAKGIIDKPSNRNELTFESDKQEAREVAQEITDAAQEAGIRKFSRAKPLKQGDKYNMGRGTLLLRAARNYAKTPSQKHFTDFVVAMRTLRGADLDDTQAVDEFLSFVKSDFGSDVTGVSIDRGDTQAQAESKSRGKQAAADKTESEGAASKSRSLTGAERAKALKEAGLDKSVPSKESKPVEEMTPEEFAAAEERLSKAEAVVKKAKAKAAQNKTERKPRVVKKEGKATENVWRDLFKDEDIKEEDGFLVTTDETGVTYYIFDKGFDHTTLTLKQAMSDPRTIFLPKQNIVVLGLGQSRGARLSVLTPLFQNNRNHPLVANIDAVARAKGTSLNTVWGPSGDSNLGWEEVESASPKPFTRAGRRKRLERMVKDGTALKMSTANAVGYVSNFKLSQNLKGQKAGFEAMLSNLLRIVGNNVPVYIVPAQDVASVNSQGQVADGFYAGDEGFIVLNEGALSRGKGLRALTHELAHAATTQGIIQNPRLLEAVDIIARAFKRDGKNVGKQYAFRNPEEFVAEMFSNPAMAKNLARTRASSGLKTRVATLTGTKPGAIKTLWDAFRSLMARVLGVRSSDYSLLDAVMELGPSFEQAIKDSGIIPAPIQLQALRQVEGDMALMPGSPFTAEGPSFPAWVEAAMADSGFAQFTDRASIEEMRGMGGSVLKTFSSKLRNAGTKWSTRQHLANSWKDHKAIGEQVVNFDKVMSQVETISKPIKEKSVQAAGKLKTALENELRAHKPEIMSLITTYSNLQGQPEKRVAPADILSTDANKWMLKKNGKPRRGMHKAVIDMPLLQARFNALPEAAQDLILEYGRIHRELYDQQVDASIQGMLAESDQMGIDLTDVNLDELATRIKTSKMTADDKKTLGTALFNVFELEAFQKRKGLYAPALRYGDWVVFGKMNIDNTYGGKLLEPNKVLFTGKTIDEAIEKSQEFLEKAGLDELRSEYKQVDDDGNILSAEEAVAYGDTQKAVIYTMQTDILHMFESEFKANEFIRNNPYNYPREHMPTETEPRFGLSHEDHVLSGTQMSTLSAEFQRKVKAGEMDEATANHMNKMLHQASARMMRGNRLSQRRLKRRNVIGASDDLVRNLMHYGHAAGNHVASALALPAARKAIRDARANLKTYKGEGRAGAVQVINEIELRIKDGITDPMDTPRALQTALTTSQFVRLASVAYNLINMTQPTVVTGPELVKDHPVKDVIREWTRAYKDLGFGKLMAGGALNTFRAANWKNWNATAFDNSKDLLGDMRKRLAALPDGDGLIKGFNHLIKHNAISDDVGFEVSRQIMEGASPLGKMIGRFDQVFRQMPQAVEHVNRVHALIAGWRLAKKKGLNDDDAMEYVYNLVKLTQGDYTPGNSPRYFNNAWLKPATQFKKYGLVYLYNFGRAVRQVVNPKTKEERVQGARALASYFAVQIAVAGAMGLPGLDLAKGSIIVASMLGLTEEWSEWEEWLEEIAKETAGEEWGSKLMNGVITQSIGIDTSQRLSAGDFALFGDPGGDTQKDYRAYIFNMLAGSPGVYGMDAVEGMKLLGEGELLKGLGKVAPIKTLGDALKAGDRYQKGDIGIGTGIINTIGFKTVDQRREGEEAGRRMRLAIDRRKQKSKYFDKWFDTEPRSKDEKALEKEIKEWNDTVPLSYRVHVNPMRGNKEEQRKERRGYNEGGLVTTASKPDDKDSRISFLEKSLADLSAAVNKPTETPAPTKRSIRVVRNEETGLIERLEQE